MKSKPFACKALVYPFWHFGDKMDERVGLKIKALYEHGWEIGEISYFNTVLQEYRVTFADNSEDYIRMIDIDGVEIQFV